MAVAALCMSEQTSCMSPVGSERQNTCHVGRHNTCYVQCLTDFDCIAAEDIADLGVCYSAGLQALVGETKVHLWQKGDTT